MATGYVVGQITMFLGVQRPRQWNLDEKLALGNASMAPGPSIGEAGRAADVDVSLIYNLRGILVGLGAREAASVPPFCRCRDQAEGPCSSCCRQSDRARTSQRQGTDTAQRVARAFESHLAGVVGMVLIQGHARV